ncbi:hypothetical protein [Nitrosospira sp. Nsp18]|uniref:hypothetical protein n=1 Tax=Nitrosospira sp. Nsp18 TaxID=1855334 RepID=UPI00115FFA71|nr:hypothetical protein [Nitrosospira sp. Nsp18]
MRPLTESARKSGNVTDDDAEGEELRSEIKNLDKKISNLSNLLSETTATEPLIQKMEEFADRRALLHDQPSTLDVVRRQAKAMREIKESDVEAMLAAILDNLPELDRNATAMHLKICCVV